MIVIHCPECESSHVKRHEEEIERTGQDYFNCKECGYVFHITESSYSEEYDIYE